MALHGSAVANLSPILFKGNNRSLGVNLIIHQDKSASMDSFSQFYNDGSFIGELQEALLNKNIGSDIGGYPNLYAYFGVFSRNPSIARTIKNPNGTLTINQSFMVGLDDKNATTYEWVNEYINNSTSHVVNICTNVIDSTTGGRLSGYGNELGGGSPKSEDIHGSIWSIFTSPNAISTGTPGRYGSVIGSNVRRGSTNIIITNSDEQDSSPSPMIDELVNSGGIERTINGPSGEVSIRNYRVFGLNSYNIPDYDGILYYGNTSSFPYGLVKFTSSSTYNITRTSTLPNITVSTAISGSEFPHVNLTASPEVFSPPIYTQVPESIYASGKYIFLSGYPPHINNYDEIQGKTYIHISDDASLWEIITPDVNDLLQDIAYDGSSTFVAVGTRGCIVRTTDNWQTITNHSLNSFLGNYEVGFVSVTYGNGKFVAVSYSNLQIYTSTNGINWNPQSVNFSYSVRKIRYLNGYFYLVSSGGGIPYNSKIYRSLDAITWTEVYSDSISSGLRNIIYDGTRFIAVGTDGTDSAVVLISTNGTTWNLSLQLPTTTWVDSGQYIMHVASDGNLIILHSEGTGTGYYYTSSDGGNTWTKREKFAPTPGGQPTAHNEGGPIIFDGSKFISLRTYTSQHEYVYRITTDGINWDYRNQSVKYKFDPSWGSNSIYSFPDSSGRYYSIDASNYPFNTASFSWDSTYITISNLEGIYYEIVTRNSDSSLVTSSTVYTGSYLLSWSSSNATSVLSSSGTGFTPTALSGSITVSPTSTENYSITVQNDSGETSTATVTLEIPITTVSQTPNTINVPTVAEHVHDVITLASESRGGIFSIGNVFTNTTVDNRIAFSKCLAEFIADTV